MHYLKRENSSGHIVFRIAATLRSIYDRNFLLSHSSVRILPRIKDPLTLFSYASRTDNIFYSRKASHRHDGKSRVTGFAVVFQRFGLAQWNYIPWDLWIYNTADSASYRNGAECNERNCPNLFYRFSKEKFIRGVNPKHHRVNRNNISLFNQLL